MQTKRNRRLDHSDTSPGHDSRNTVQTEKRGVHEGFGFHQSETGTNFRVMLVEENFFFKTMQVLTKYRTRPVQVRGDPDGCGLDLSLRYSPSSELRVDLPTEDLLNIKKGWLMKQGSTSDVSVSGRDRDEKRFL